MLENTANQGIINIGKHNWLFLHAGWNILKKPKIPEEHVLFRKIWQYRNSVRHLEREYLDLRIRLRDAETGLRSDLQRRELKERVGYLKDRLKDLEDRYSWIATGSPSEIPFCVNSTGCP